MKRTLPLELPDGFRLKTVVFSHGWFDLPPFHWRAECETLATALWLDGVAADIALTQTTDRTLTVSVAAPGRWNRRRERELLATLRRMLHLESNLEAFFAVGGASFAWARAIGAGRLLCGATVFEDAVKMLATTNCSWSLTRLMVQRLVDALGVAAPSGRKAFPLPETLARQRVDFFRTAMKAGYRAPFLAAFASRVALGHVDPESWARYPGTTDELLVEIRREKGFGRYAAENLCKLVGRFDGLGIDSWCLKKFGERHGPVRGNLEKAIRKFYARFGCWQGLALWLDLTRDWHVAQVHADPTTSFQKP